VAAENSGRLEWFCFPLSGGSYYREAFPALVRPSFLSDLAYPALVLHLAILNLP